MTSMRKKIAILPASVPLACDDTLASPPRFLRLPHPRTSQPSLFLPYAPTSSSSTSSVTKRFPDGLLEVQQISPEEEKRRTWFIEDEVVSDGTLTLLTPFDPLFLLISLLSALPAQFLSNADLWDALSLVGFKSPLASNGAETKGETVAEDELERDRTMAEDIVRLGTLACIQGRLEDVCDKTEHDGTVLYRLSMSLIISLLRSKVTALTQEGTGIFGPLASTALGVKRNAGDALAGKAASAMAPEEGDIAMVDTPVGEVPSDVQPSTSESPPINVKARGFPTVSRGLGRDGVGDGQGISAAIQLEMRAKSAISILSNYLPPSVAHALLASYAFPALEAHLSTISSSSVLSSTYLPGRASSSTSLDSSSNGGGSAAAKEKKRKADAKGSRGVEALKKVNTKGMMTLGAMFAKQPVRKPVAVVADVQA